MLKSRVFALNGSTGDDAGREGDGAEDSGDLHLDAEEVKED